ncbi:MAG TPA: hypothetical protein VHV53_03345 [Solirubrobacterales bacterium]|nr:hypothetical protein [Solirubrobacterales bacterium]
MSIERMSSRSSRSGRRRCSAISAKSASSTLGQPLPHRREGIAAPAARQHRPQDHPGRAGLGEQVAQQHPQAIEARPLGDAEDGAQDHLQGDRLHPGVDRELAAELPGVDLGGDDLLHHPLVGAHPLAVEGRQHQPAAGDVLLALEQQHRARAEHRFELEAPSRRQPVAALRI